MKEYRYLLFDLDGTLTDPKEGITRSVEYALNYFGIQVADLNDLIPFIGPPLKDSFKEFYQFDEEKAETALEKYRERFAETGILENVPFEGIHLLLQKAKEKGYTLMIATSKPLPYAERILQHFNLSEAFTFVGGTGLDGSFPTKADVIRRVLLQNNIQELSEVVMIGDRKHDIIGAQTIGIDSIGVLYGYGSREELEKAGANYIVADLDELATLLDINFRTQGDSAH